jgi:hypothetical protein
MKPSKLDELGSNDQKLAIDVAVAASLLVARLPNMSEVFFDALVSEYSHQQNLPKATSRANMRAIGMKLFKTDWELVITKEGAEIRSVFTPKPVSAGGNGAGAAVTPP